MVHDRYAWFWRTNCAIKYRSTDELRKPSCNKIKNKLLLSSANIHKLQVWTGQSRVCVCVCSPHETMMSFRVKEEKKIFGDNEPNSNCFDWLLAEWLTIVLQQLAGYVQVGGAKRVPDKSPPPPEVVLPIVKTPKIMQLAAERKEKITWTQYYLFKNKNLSQTGHGKKSRCNKPINRSERLTNGHPFFSLQIFCEFLVSQHSSKRFDY